jgi:hypothetical protein
VSVKVTVVEVVNGAEILRQVMRSSVAERLSTGTKIGRRHFSRTVYWVRRKGQKDQRAGDIGEARSIAKGSA